MKNAVYRAVNKTLTVVLAAAIVANVGLAFYQCHVRTDTTVTFSFGDPPVQPASEGIHIDASAIAPTDKDLAALPVGHPVPQHKPCDTGYRSTSTCGADHNFK